VNGGQGDGIDATGGTAPQSGTGGNGLTGIGGASSGVFNAPNTAGIGVVGEGGSATFGGPTPDTPGPGGSFSGGEGGYCGDGLCPGGDGLDAFGGPASGTGIVATGGTDNFGIPDAGEAGVFNGNISVTGNIAKSGGSFKIDDPIDPENKYLYHSFVESPDMMNIYNGNVVTDGSGTAVVRMPDYFQALNTDFRYQLTAIGQPAQAYIGSKISNGVFTIKTDKPNVEVSWQVTGIRQDAWANAHRIPNEVEKDEREKGHYLHPELFGHRGELSIPEIEHPALAAHNRKQ
jgi:hypothetical protein